MEMEKRSKFGNFLYTLINSINKRNKFNDLYRKDPTVLSKGSNPEAVIIPSILFEIDQHNPDHFPEEKLKELFDEYVDARIEDYLNKNK